MTDNNCVTFVKVVSVRSYILFFGLLSFSINAIADWEAAVVADAAGNVSQYSLRASDEFPMFTLSCVSGDALPVDMVQIDRLTASAFDKIERLEIQVDANPVMIFYPDQHKINIGFQYHQSIENGIETVTAIPADDSGEIQYAELIRQFIEGNRSIARVISASDQAQVSFSLAGFTRAYLPMRTACLESAESIAQDAF